MKRSNVVRPKLLDMIPEAVIPGPASVGVNSSRPAPHLMPGIQVSSTGPLFSQGHSWIPVFTGMTSWLKQQKNLFKELKGLSFLRKQESKSYFLVLMNSKGISVLFLLIAMLLMITIGYVFSYLIPTKQKSVKFSMYSNQAFFIAQSGVEFAIRYASDRGWRGTTDGGTFDINRLNGLSRTLGNGTLTLAYNNAVGNILTSTGQITGVSENRVVRVSNFSSFLRLIFNPASPVPCWYSGVKEARFYIRNARASAVSLTAFSATWNQTANVYFKQLKFNGGIDRWDGVYYSGGGVVNFNKPNPPPPLQPWTIAAGAVSEVLLIWDTDMGNPRNIIFTFYTATGDKYTFNLDAAGNGLPTC